MAELAANWPERGVEIKPRMAIRAIPTEDYKDYERNHERVKINYLGKEFDKPQLFLNEARLSAIAISIYLGMIKRHIQGNPLKILF